MTGFTNRSILAGIVGIDEGSTNQIHPENGDFLGPELYPWANKVVFSYPPIAAYYFRKGLVSSNDNLRIDTDDESFETTFTVSALRPYKGVSVKGPTTPGGDIYVGAELAADANKFLSISQITSTNNTPVTTITHSKVSPGRGIAVQGPNSSGGDVIISSIITKPADNHFLKIEQNTSTNATTSTTTLTPATLTSGTGVSVQPPTTDGGNVIFNLDVNGFENGSGIQVSQGSGGKIKISSSGLNITIKNTDGNLTITQSGNTFTINLSQTFLNRIATIENNLNNFKQAAWDDNGALWHALNVILGRLPGGSGTNKIYTFKTGTKTKKTKFNSYTGDITFTKTPSFPGDADNWRFAIGNLNIHSSNNRSIVTHRTDDSGDLTVN